MGVLEGMCVQRRRKKELKPTGVVQEPRRSSPEEKLSAEVRDPEV